MILIIRISYSSASIKVGMNPQFQLPKPLRKLLPASLAVLASGVELRKESRLILRREKPSCMVFAVSGEIALERVDEQGTTVVLQRVHGGFFWSKPACN